MNHGEFQSIQKQGTRTIETLIFSFLQFQNIAFVIPSC